MGPLSSLLIDDPVISIPAAIAAALIAYGIIYRKGILPIYHFFRSVARIADATPILVTMAEEFHPNGGGSLRDVVDRIESKVDGAVIVAENTKQVAETATQDISSKLDEHLRNPAWHKERDDILSRLTVLEERQRTVLEGMSRALNPDTPLDQIVEKVREALSPEDPQNTPTPT